MQRRGTGRAWGQCSHSRAACRLFLSARCANGTGSRVEEEDCPHLGAQARRHKAGRQLHGRPLLGWDSSNEAAHGRDVAVGLQHRGQARALSCNVVGWRAGGCAGGQGSLSARHAMAPERPRVIGRAVVFPAQFWILHPVLPLSASPACPPVPCEKSAGWDGDGFGWRSAGDQIGQLCILRILGRAGVYRPMLLTPWAMLAVTAQKRAIVA